MRTSDPEHEYDIEMQTTDEKDLPLRARYYQSLMDIEATQRGAKYKALKQNVVIFICLFDPFGMGEPVYTIRSRCEENPATEYDDRMVKVFYNCRDCDRIEDRETREFLRYVAHERPASDYTRRLEERVRSFKVTPRELMYYNNWLEFRDEARAEGRAEGAHDAKIETARAMLANGKLSQEEIADITQLSAEEVVRLTQTAAAR